MSKQKIDVLFKIFKNAAASDNPGQSIVDSIETLKESDPDLWELVNETRSNMLDSLNAMSQEDRIEAMKEFKKFNEGKS